MTQTKETKAEKIASAIDFLEEEGYFVIKELEDLFDYADFLESGYMFFRNNTEICLYLDDSPDILVGHLTLGDLEQFAEMAGCEIVRGLTDKEKNRIIGKVIASKAP